MANATTYRYLSPSGEKNDLAHFLKSLGALRLSGRKATKPRDYVNSVWVDCPRFQIPQNFMTMDLLSLLENALDQLQENHRVVPITATPAGLLGASSGTTLWKPSLYLENAKITNIGQVYSSLVRPFRSMPVTNKGMVPLQFIDARASALSNTAIDYERQMGEHSNVFAFDHLKTIVQLWPEETRRELSTPKDFDEMSGIFEGGYKMLGQAAKFGANILRKIPSAILSGDSHTHPDHESINQFRSDSRSLLQTHGDELEFRLHVLSIGHESMTLPTGKINHAKIAYWMVAEAMGLDYKLCQKSGLRLMGPVLALRTARTSLISSAAKMGEGSKQSAFPRGTNCLEPQCTRSRKFLESLTILLRIVSLEFGFL